MKKNHGMCTVKEILVRKGSLKVHTIAESARVMEAVSKMNENHIGSLAATRADGSVSGIITERDVLRRVGEALETLKTALVGDVMTKHVLVCTPSTTLNEVRSTMKSHRIRHLPVVAKAHSIWLKKSQIN